MAENDQPSRLEAATIRAEVGSDIVYRVANLPADQTVATDSGNIPTLAGVLDYVQNEGDAAAADVRAKADAQVQAAIGTLVKKAGDTMTGALTLSGAPTSNLHASTKKYVDDRTVYQLPAPADVDAGKTVQVNGAGNGYALVTAGVKYFETPQIVITTDSSVAPSSYAHSLGSVPKGVSLLLVCVVAEAGYSVGDRVEFNSSPYGWNNGGTNTRSGFSVKSNATSLVVRPTTGNILLLSQNVNESYFSITFTSWRLVARCWA